MGILAHHASVHFSVEDESAPGSNEATAAPLTAMLLTLVVKLWNNNPSRPLRAITDEERRADRRLVRIIIVVFFIFITVYLCIGSRG
jgi:hypothetical protein